MMRILPGHVVVRSFAQPLEACRASRINGSCVSDRGHRGPLQAHGANSPNRSSLGKALRVRRDHVLVDVEAALECCDECQRADGEVKGRVDTFTSGLPSLSPTMSPYSETMRSMPTFRRKRSQSLRMVSVRASNVSSTRLLRPRCRSRLPLRYSRSNLNVCALAGCAGDARPACRRHCRQSVVGCTPSRSVTNERSTSSSNPPKIVISSCCSTVAPGQHLVNRRARQADGIGTSGNQQSDTHGLRTGRGTP
jgi:hypothetical protein